MRNALYWQKRFDTLQASLLNKGIEYYNNLSEQYNKAALNVQKEIEVFYQRFADNNQMDLLEARKLLNTRQLKEFRWSVEEYIKKGETLNYSDQWAKELENASTRYRISRLQALQLQMQQQVEELMGNEVDGLDNVISDIYQDGYYRSIFEVQKGAGVGESFAILDKNKISKVISKPWAADGTNFSERVWGEHRASLVQSLNSDFIQAVIRGDSPNKLVKKIADDFGVAKYKAKRLVLTESAFFSSESRKDAFKELDVGWFKISATLDKSTCEDCGWREGNDPIPIGMYQVGYTSPPFHPNCRCTAIPLEDFNDGLESYRAARDENGTYYKVPDNMTYTQWKEKYVGGKSDNKVDNDKGDNKSDGKKTKNKAATKIKLNKLKKQLAVDEYKTYVGMIEKNENIANLYRKYGNKVSKIEKIDGGGYYKPYKNTLSFSDINDELIKAGLSKFNTLAHEYGHAFDNLAECKNLHFEEVNMLDKYCKIGLYNGKRLFDTVPSSSDEFISALRKDAETLKIIHEGKKRKKVLKDLLSSDASYTVQDVISGFCGFQKVNFGHSEEYYDFVFDKYINLYDQQSNMEKAFKELGFNIKTEEELKQSLKIYRIACEAWAGLMSAETCQDKTLDYIKKYLPNSYKAFLDIIKDGINYE